LNVNVVLVTADVRDIVGFPWEEASVETTALDPGSAQGVGDTRAGGLLPGVAALVDSIQAGVLLVLFLCPGPGEAAAVDQKRLHPLVINLKCDVEK
jgi:hypothetical protein